MAESESIKKNTIHKMIYFINNHRRVMEKYLDRTGVFQSQHRLLMMISHNPNSSQKELAEKMKISTATIAVSLKKLEKGGYILRNSSEDDFRANHVEITRKGQEVVEKSKEIFTKVDNTVFEGFTDEEIEKFSEQLDKIIENLLKL